MTKSRGRFVRFLLHPYALHAGRWTWYASAALLFLAAVVLLVLRLWLPAITGHSEVIARFLSEKSGQKVLIEEAQPYWRGLHPGLRLLGVEVYGPHGVHPAVRLQEIRASISWLPLLRGRVEANELTLVQPELALERRADGRFKLFGLRAQAAAPEEGTEERFVSRLFAQKEINVEDATLRWIDRKAQSPPLALSHVNITLRNSGAHHRFGMSALFPPGMCRDCSFIADITGNPLRLEPWAGRVYVRATGVNLAAFPPIVRERLPASLDGVFDVQLWSEWTHARPQSVHGQVAAARLQFPDTAWTRNVTIRQASSQLDWERHGEGWRLSLKGPRLALDGRAWSPEQIDVEYGRERSRISVAHVNLDDAAWAASRVAGDHPLLQAITAMHPRGSIDTIEARIEGPWSKSADYQVDADVSGVRTEPYQHVPGVRGISGHVRLERNRGEATLRSEHGELNFAKVFAAPISIGRASGHVRWERQPDRWRVVADQLRAQSKDGRAEGELEVQWPLDRSLSPVVRVSARGSDLDLTQASRYYPINVTSERFRAWLNQSIGGGTVVSAQVDLDGPVRQFPFRAGGGRFEARAHVINGTFTYLQGWQPIQRIDAELLFRGSEMIATGDGKMRGLDVGRVVVHVPDLHGPDGPVVSVGGAISGPLQDTLTVLRERRTEPGQLTVPTALAATGDGVLGLDIVIPVHHAHDFTLRGEYQFNNNLLAFGALHASSVQGLIGFTQAGLRNGQVRARVLGGDAVMTVIPSERDPYRADRVDASGTLTQAGLTELWNDPAAPVRLAGPVPWEAQVRMQKAVPHLTLHADLGAMETAFPPPLDKAAGASLPLLVSTESATPDNQVLTGALGDRAYARLQFNRAGGVWQLQRGHVALGERAPPALGQGSGLWASLAAPDLDVDRWLRYFNARSGAGDHSAPPDVLTRVSVWAGATSVFERRFGPVTLDLNRDRSAWRGRIDGREVAGQVQVSAPGARQPDPAITLRLARLIVPARTIGPKGASGPSKGGGRWPRLDVTSNEFQLDQWHLGRLEFVGSPLGDGFRVDRLALTRPDTVLEASGQWQGTARPRSLFQGSLKSSDVGQTLAALNLPDQVEGGKAEVQGQLSWPGGPSDFNLARLSGKVSVNATKGSFVKVRQGAGKLLGLFDVRSLARYLTFDFSSIFGKGYVFDQVRGNIAVDEGNAHTDDLVVIGPSASLRIQGRTGLARKDFDLQIGVEPHLRDNITVAGALIGGPIGAGAAWVMQRLLRKPIAASTRIVYIVKGPWENPTIQRVGHNTQ